MEKFDQKSVRLPEVRKGDLLQEVTRAYLHGSMPSALVRRVLDGVEEFVLEANQNPEDTKFTREFVARLAAFLANEKKVEQDTYGM